MSLFISETNPFLTFIPLCSPTKFPVKYEFINFSLINDYTGDETPIKNFTILLDGGEQPSPEVPTDKTQFASKEYIDWVASGTYTENKNFGKINDAIDKFNIGSKILWNLHKIYGDNPFLRYIDIFDKTKSSYLSTVSNIPATGGTVTLTGYCINGNTNETYEGFGNLTISSTILTQTSVIKIECFTSAVDLANGTPIISQTFTRTSSIIRMEVIGYIKITITTDAQTSSSTRSFVVTLKNNANKTASRTITQNSASIEINPPSGYSYYCIGTMNIGNFSWSGNQRRGYYISQGGSITITSKNLKENPHVTMAQDNLFIQVHLGSETGPANDYVWCRVDDFYFLDQMNSGCNGIVSSIFVNINNKSQTPTQAKQAFYNYLNSNIGKTVPYKLYFYNSRPSV